MGGWTGGNSSIKCTRDTASIGLRKSLQLSLLPRLEHRPVLIYSPSRRLLISTLKRVTGRVKSLKTDHDVLPGHSAVLVQNLNPLRSLEDICEARKSIQSFRYLSGESLRRSRRFVPRYIGPFLSHQPRVVDTHLQSTA